VCKKLLIPRQKEAIFRHIWPLSLNWTQERQLGNQTRLGFVPRIHVSCSLIPKLTTKCIENIYYFFKFVKAKVKLSLCLTKNHA